MKFKEEEKKAIDVLVKSGITMYSKVARKLLKDGYCVDKAHRTVREALAEYLSIVPIVTKKAKILIYDIETPRVEARLWWSGKQYVNGMQLTSEPNVITIAWKWLGEEKVYVDKWDKKQSDKKLMKNFLKVYNQADMVIGYNNDKFDNKWINVRALKHNLDVNTYVQSYDIMKQSKGKNRLPSYSMNALAKFVGVETKLQHSGLQMWNNIQFGTKEEAKESMQLMVDYNIQDYLATRKYFKSPIHVGVLNGGKVTSCPACGCDHSKLYKTVTSIMGTKQHVMQCDDCESKYKISNTNFNKI